MSRGMTYAAVRDLMETPQDVLDYLSLIRSLSGEREPDHG